MIRRIKTGQSAAAKAENSGQVRATVEGILGDIAARLRASLLTYDGIVITTVPFHLAGVSGLLCRH